LHQTADASTYGSLVDDASKVTLPNNAPPPKSADHYQLIGKPVGDVDARAIVTGQMQFAIDQQDGDALVAVVTHCPWPDGTLDHLDTTDALAVKGVVKVVQLKPEPGQPWGSTVIATRRRCAGGRHLVRAAGTAKTQARVEAGCQQR
jgi:isoquinoline 1-oxidoreductase beta subunit